MQDSAPQHKNAENQQLVSQQHSTDKERLNNQSQLEKQDNKNTKDREDIDDKLKSVLIQKIQEKLLDNKYQDILDILIQNKDIDITNISDRKGFSLIHRMTLHMKLTDIQFMVKYALKFYEFNVEKDQLIKKWINQQNIEGFTALHYSSFKGEVDITEYLISLGGDYTIKNKNDLNVLHIAAQGDQPISLCYFDKIDLDLNAKDQKGGSALHWACYLGSENAVNYLVSKIKDQINSKDREGLTPLHLAVISGNARVIKKLLQRGADRNAVDQNNKTPIKLAEENEYFNIQQMLEKTSGFAEYCNIKQPFKPMKKNPRQLIVLILMLLFTEGSIFSFILPCFDHHFIEFSVWVFFMIGTIISLILAWRTDPGFVNGIKKNTTSFHLAQSDSISILQNNQNNTLNLQVQNRNNENFSSSKPNNSQLDELNQNLLSENQKKDERQINVISRVEFLNELISLYKNNEVSRVCVECCIVKPKRSRHCEICKKCVRVYDHHCPWINNCVGTNNYKYFIWFIIFMWFNMLSGLILILLHVTSDYKDDDNWIFNWFSDLDQDTKNILKIVKYVASGSVIALILFFFVLHSILCFVQISNLFLNKTTFERYNTHQQQNNESENSQNPRKSSQIKNQSSITDVNPSIILSNHLNQNINNHNKDKKNEDQFSFKNASIMCFQNAKDPQYDYSPPFRSSRQNQNNINQHLVRQLNSQENDNQNS